MRAMRRGGQPYAVIINPSLVTMHLQALPSMQVRMEDVVQCRNPTDPFAHKPGIGQALRAESRKR